MNNPWLMAAVGLTVVIVLSHSVIGERRIFRHLRRDGHRVPTEGGVLLREYQVRILWATWHAVSLMGLAQAGVLIWLDQPAAQLVSAGRIEWCVALAMAATGTLVLVSNRGRHPAWLALFGVAAMVLMSH